MIWSNNINKIDFICVKLILLFKKMIKTSFIIMKSHLGFEFKIIVRFYSSEKESLNIQFSLVTS